jgi:hypothetical protein
MLFILFGTRGRQRKLDEGEFYCPHEHAQRHYHLKKASQWFTLYFIPIFPIRQLGEFVECQSCGRTYDVKVLHLKPEDIQAKPQPRNRPVNLMNNMAEHLHKGMPVEYLVRDLTATGLDRDLVLKMVDDAIGSRRVHCQSCRLSYAPSLTTCAECGEPVH